MNDLISRQAALEAVENAVTKECARWVIKELPSAQPEITLESAIDYLHSIGWMQEHDRIMAESAQPEIIRCKDCNKASKCYGDVVMRSRGGGYIYCPLEFCSEAERRTE